MERKEDMQNKKEKLVRFNKTNILEAAEALFAEKGVVQTTMDDIAKKADYSKSTIYVYFKSKEEIYNHIILLHMMQLEEAAQLCAEKTEKFETCFYDFCNQLVYFYEQYPMYFDGMMGNISIDPSEMSKNMVLQQIYDVGEKINDHMLLLFNRGKKEKYLREDIDIMPTVFTLWASLGGIISLAHEKEAYIDQRINMKKNEFLQHSFTMLIDSLRRKK